MRTKFYFLLIVAICVGCVQQKRFLIDYSYTNIDKNLNEIQGDFENIRFKDTDYNFMVKYFKTYQKYKNCLVVMVRTTETSNISIKNRKVTVFSEKFGKLKEIRTSPVKTYIDYPPVLFVGKLNTTIVKAEDVLSHLKEDSVTVYIDAKKYTFKASKEINYLRY